jgi:hypothetical protein
MKTTRRDGTPDREPGGADGNGPKNRTPPPDSTGFEQRYLETRAAAGAPVRVHLDDGERLEGPVRDVDRDHLEIEHAGRRVRVRKARVRYLEEL